MRSTICISASLCVWAAAGLAEVLPGPGACFQQRYDAAHLAAHPQQGVAELRLWFFDTEPGVTSSRSVIAAARMASQGQGARDGVGGLTLRVEESPIAVQPNPFARGETVVVPRSRAEMEQEPGIGLAEVDGGTSLAQLVAGLNALGVGPRDMIDILNTINAAGALHAELVVR